MATLISKLTATPSSPPTYNVGMAETFSWIPVEGAGRPLFARANYITNFEDFTVSISAAELTIDSITLKDGNSNRVADVESAGGKNALCVLTQDLEPNVDTISLADKNFNNVSVNPSTSSLNVNLTNPITAVKIVEDVTISNPVTSLEVLNTVSISGSVTVTNPTTGVFILNSIALKDLNNNNVSVNPSTSSLNVNVTNFEILTSKQFEQITLLKELTSNTDQVENLITNSNSFLNVLTSENLYGTKETLPSFVATPPGSALQVNLYDSAQLDAFGRLRVSQPYALFDSKSLFDQNKFFWNFRQRDGSEVFNDNDASRTCSITAADGFFVKETYRRFAYQPGRSYLCLFTGVLSAEPNVVKRVGMFTSLSGNDYQQQTTGIYFQSLSSSSTSPSQTQAWVINNNTNLVSSQSAVQQDWNIDRMDGSGPSKVDLDFSKAQIFIIDYEWLGVGRVRCGFNVNGRTYYCHQFLNANNISGTYMRYPNLPIRTEIRGLAGATSGSMKTICASIISEGGEDPTYVTRAISLSSGIDIDSANVRRGLLGIRLRKDRSFNASTIVDLHVMPVIDQQNSFCPFKWELVMRPTPTIGDSWKPVSDSSSFEYKQSISPGLTIVGGEVVASGFANRETQVSLQNINFEKVLKLGRSLDEISDECWLCVTCFSTHPEFYASFTVAEAD